MSTGSPRFKAATVIVAATVVFASHARADLVADQYSVFFGDYGGLGSFPIETFANGTSFGFNWDAPSDAVATSINDSGQDVYTLTLPTFMISANPGYTLSGVSLTLGGTYTILGPAAISSAQVSGEVLTSSFYGSLSDQAIFSKPGPHPDAGNWFLNGSVNTGSFSSLAFYNGSVRLVAAAGAESAASSIAFRDAGPRFEFQYAALPVPEPAEWALMLLGMAFVAGRARRKTALQAEPA